jgi:hypothetical protein
VFKFGVSSAAMASLGIATASLHFGQRSISHVLRKSVMISFEQVEQENFKDITS